MNQGIKKALSLFKTQQSFADAIGVGKQTVTHWKTGRRNPNRKNCIKIVKATNNKVSLDELISN